MDSPIPRIIHQTWKSDHIPAEWEGLRKTWRRLNPEWEYRLWTDDDNLELVAKHYPWFLDIYKGYDQGIKRADAARYFIMHQCGGVYVDLDFEALRPLDELVMGKVLLLGWEPQDHVDREPALRSRALTKILGNAFLASVPRHPFWEAVFQGLLRCHRLSGVLDATGPFLLTRVYRDYPGKPELTITPSQTLYPVTKWEAWNGALESDELRSTLLGAAYAVHHWHGSYRRRELIDLVRQHLAEKD
jgi:mannosyltransferase OCH1-like enzyme